jgi:hypothetical protein
MDSQHRHELQTNDLAEFITHFKEWWTKHGTNTLLGILIVVAVIFFMRWYSGRETRILNEAYGELAAAADPFAKTEVAGKYESIDGFASTARLQAADMLLRQAIGVTPSPNSEDAPTGEERTNMLNQAATLYERVTTSGSTKLQVLNARFGLAAVKESLSDFDAARAQYQKIQEEAGADWPTLAAKAGRLEGDLAEIRRPVNFPEPPAAPVISTPTPEEGTINLTPDLNSIIPQIPAPAPASAPVVPEIPGEKPAGN